MTALILPPLNNADQRVWPECFGISVIIERHFKIVYIQNSGPEVLHFSDRSVRRSLHLSVLRLTA